MALNNLTRIGNSGFGTDTSINTTGIVTAASFSGDGSGLTGVTALGSGVVVQEEGSNVGTAQTINFIGTGVTATFSGGIASVEIATSGGGGGGGLSNVVEDTTPQLGGNLDLNSNNITGTGDISITGDATFSGDLDVDGHVNLDNVSIAGVSTFTGNVSFGSTATFGSNDEILLGDSQELSLKYSSSSSAAIISAGGNPIDIKGTAIRLKSNLDENIIVGTTNDSVSLYYDNSKKFETTNTGAIVTGTLVATATTATNVTVANEASDTECFVMFGVNATGDNAPKSSSSLKYNSSTGGLSAGSFIGDGSGLTGITASGSGVIVRDDGSLVGTAGTIDFGSNVSVSPISAGVVTVTAAAGSIPGISTSQTTQLNNLTVAGVSTSNGVTVSDSISIGTTAYFNKGNNKGIFFGVPPFDSGLDALIFVSDTSYANSLCFSNIDYGARFFVDEISLNRGSSQFVGLGTEKSHFGGSSEPNYMVGIGTTNPTSTLDVGGTLNVSGVVTATTFSGSGASLTTLNASELDSGTIPDARFPATLPAISGANLTNLPASGISTAFTNVQATWSVGGDTSGYTFTGPGQDGAEQNPDIYLVRGQRYRFINTTGTGHPFRIQSDTSGTAYTDGVSGSQSGTQDFNVQHDAPVRLYYQCTIHSGMIGNIYIVGGSDWRMTDVLTNQTPEIFTNLNVGIGTTNPNAELQLNSDGFTNLTIASSRTTATDQIGGVGFSTYFNGTQDQVAAMTARVDGNIVFKNTTSNLERLNIRSDGDVVIGTNDLENNLDSRRRLAICDTTNGALLHIRGQSPAIYFDQSAGNTPKIYLDNAGLEIWSHTPASAGTNFFKIDSNGYRSFSTQPYVLLRKDGTTANITADAIVEFDTTVTSEGGMTVNGSRSRITVPKAGKYAVLGAVAGSNTTVSVGDGWRLDLYRDGGVYENAYMYPINTVGAATGEEYTLQTSLIVPADANDYFEFKIASVGAARASVRYGYFCVYYLG